VPRRRGVTERATHQVPTWRARVVIVVRAVSATLPFVDARASIDAMDRDLIARVIG
jgi:hypothetical protein